MTDPTTTTRFPVTTFVRRAGAPDRLLVVFSDIEMGGGGAVDDFPHSAFLGDLLLAYAGDAYAHLHVDVVFNGDTFDLLKTAYRGGYPRHVTEEVALGKMATVAEAHAPFFRALDAFFQKLGPRARAFFVLGNHDMELLFPAVQQFVRRAAGGHDAIHFPGYWVDLGRVHVEHGSQQDPLFRMDPARPFVRLAQRDILNLSWASVALLDVAIPLQPLLYHHDRLKPKRMVLELIPEVRELLLAAYWQYWARDYWRDRAADPVKTVSWSMVKELVRRMVLSDPEVAMDDEFQRRMVASDEFDLYLVGHQHEPGWWTFGRRKVMRTGPFRDEFMLSDGGRVQTPINKTYAEVFMAGEHVVRSHLVELVGPERPAGTMPASIFDVVPAVRARLAPEAAREQEHAAQEAQEAREGVVRIAGWRKK